MKYQPVLECLPGTICYTTDSFLNIQGIEAKARISLVVCEAGV